MSTTITANMGLVVPGVGSEQGPDWAQEINADLGVLDQHDHSPGFGVPITPSGISINANLPLNGNNLTTVKTVNFSAQGSSLSGVSPNLGCVYVAGNELYYNDEAGNVVQITSVGSVNAGAGSITGLPSGTASASYSGGKFVWQSATSTAANMDAGSYIYRNAAASSKGLTLSPPNAMAADFGLVLPSIPGTTSFVTLDTSGNLSGAVSTTAGITGSNIAAGTVTGSNIAASTITLSNLAASLIQYLSPPGTILPFGGTSAPTGYLLCDGTSYLRATYPDLFTAISTAYGAADGTHFNVPDLRGQFMRGVTGASANDPDASSRTAMNAGGNTGNNVGSVQTDELKSHFHSASTQTSGGFPTAICGAGGGPNGTFNTNSTGGNETRPINAYVNFIIRT